MFIVYDKVTKEVKYECSFLPAGEVGIMLPAEYPEGVVGWKVSEDEELLPVYATELTEVQMQIGAKISRIRTLKKLLADTDYQAIKFAEGELTAEEYAEVKQSRREWRSEINQAQGEIEQLL